jgi:hypothetical protein
MWIQRILMILKGILMFFLRLIVSYHDNLLRISVSIDIFLKKHLILIEKRFSNNLEWIYGHNALPRII